MSKAEALVGREGELALASAATRELFEGRASVLVIEGEAGIGKTRLVQRIVDDARSRGAAVFSGQAHPFERTRPFGVVSAALGLSRRSPDPRRAAIAALLAGEDAAAHLAARRRHPVPGRRGDRGPGRAGGRRRACWNSSPRWVAWCTVSTR